MKPLTALFVLLTLFSFQSFSQNAAIKGTVIDTAEKRNLYQAVIALMRYDDSVLVKFVRSDHDGHFTIKNIPAGKYYLITTFPRYADFVDEITISGDTIVNMDKLVLTPAATLLEAVVVRQNVAIRIKGDTIEYKADSFKVAEGANVQELLRKMPGMQVDRNGQITAQGQKVEKILVDGEEFFSDDPAVVTTNLRADAIDKVQSFDKKSDQAEFTGIDDGVRSKTLNLVMKEDKKKGYFGKLSAGVGTEDRHSGDAMLNYFKGKKKMSAYGIMSNTGKVGLDWSERDKFGGGNDLGDATVEVGAGMIMISGGGDRDFSEGSASFNGEGIPRAWKAGAHFSNKWNNDINHINTNYNIKKMDVDAAGSSITQLFLADDSSIYTNESHRSANSQMQQTFTGFYDLKLDSFSSIRFRLNGLVGNNKSVSQTDATVLDGNQDPLSRNRRNNITDADNRIVLASLLWRQRLKKKGRTFSLFASHKYSEMESTGFLIGDIFSYDDNNAPVLDSAFDQLKSGYNKTLTSQARAVYTEPLSAKTTLELNYTFNRNAVTSDRKAFDKVNGKYDAFNQPLSNNYSLLFYSNTGGAKIQYNSKKLVANIGANAGVSNYVQRDSLDRKVNHFSYTNVLPSAQVNYRFSTQRMLMFQYNGAPQPPSIGQVQPVRVNDDPFNIVIGNPNLKQAFINNIGLFYNDFKVLTGRSIWMNAGMSLISNAIVQSQTIDGRGARTLQYVNTSGNHNAWAYASYGFKIKKPEINVNIDVNARNSRYVTFLNGSKNTSDNNSVGFGLGFYRYKESKYNIGINGSANKNFGKTSGNTGNVNAQNNFWTFDSDIDGDYYFTKRLSIGSRLDMNFREKIEGFEQNNNVLMWNGNISYKIFPKRNGEFRLEAFDILNQRKGFERYFSNNTLIERNYQVLTRYFMLTFTWNFTKTPAVEAPKK
jgi:hypothetical protein